MNTLNVRIARVNPDAGRVRDRAANICCILLALALAWAMKAFYSRAAFESLRWVLAPTRRVVEWLTGAVFESEPGEGYLGRDRLYLIAPACAGINFMIVAFTSLACGLMHTRAGWRARMVLLLASGCAAYGVSVLANATRIALAMRLHDAGTAFGALTPERLHAALGTAVYLLFLCALFATAARLTGARRDFAC